MRVTTRFL